MRKLKVTSLTPGVYRVKINKIVVPPVRQFLVKIATKVVEKLSVLTVLYAIFHLLGLKLAVGF